MGDAQALGPLYERYRNKVYAVVRSQRGQLSPPDAEDLCHEVFLTLMQLAHKYDPQLSLSAWLCGIAVKKSRRLGAGRWLREKLLGPFRSKPQHVTPMTDAKIDIERALALLTAPQREIVALCLVEQLSTEEVAQALGISVNAVWVRLHRARERIREIAEAEAR